MTFARGLLKVIALAGGALITVISLMALAGVYVDSGWARAALALAVALGVPLLLVEQLLARLAPDAAAGDAAALGKLRGVTTDVLALVYVAFALVFVGVLHARSRPLLADEGSRLARAGMPRLAEATYFLAGGAPAAGGDPAAATATELAARQAGPAAKGPTTATTATTAATAPGDRKPADSKPADGKPAEARPAEARPAEPRPGDGKERTAAQIFAEFAPAVVTISIKNPLGEGGGTGFLLDRAGMVATNHHVIDDATEVKVKLMDGTIADDVEILAEDEDHDLALLQIKTSHELVPVVLGDSEKVVVGERAVSIGNPLGLDHTLTDGLISARRMLQGRRMIQMSTPVSPGNSGGPLFNSRGEVIGVSTAIYQGRSMFAQNLNLAMPINDLRGLIRPEYPGRHKVGQESAKGGRW